MKIGEDKENIHLAALSIKRLHTFAWQQPLGNKESVKHNRTSHNSRLFGFREETCRGERKELEHEHRQQDEVCSFVVMSAKKIKNRKSEVANHVGSVFGEKISSHSSASRLMPRRVKSLLSERRLFSLFFFLITPC